MKHNQGQSWSIDVIIGVIIFMLIIAILYSFLSSNSQVTVTDLDQDARVIASKLQADGIITEGVIDRTQLNILCDRTYAEIKAEMNVQTDFCIYIEDSNGNLIPCGVTANRTGVGNQADINISSSLTCGQIIN